jgi:Flp pilus assembly protein TadD
LPNLLDGLFGSAEKRARKHLSEGMRLAVQKRDEDAVRAFREAIRLSPGLADAHTQLGVSLMGKGVGAGAARTDDSAYEEAVAAFKEAIRLRPGDGRPHGHLGECLNALDRHPEAVAALEECRRLDPSYFDAVQSFRRRLECSILGRKWDGVR